MDVNSLLWVIGFNGVYNLFLFLFTKDISYKYSVLSCLFFLLIVSLDLLKISPAQGKLFFGFIGLNLILKFFVLHGYIKLIHSIYIDIPENIQKQFVLNIKIIKVSYFILFLSFLAFYFLSEDVEGSRIFHLLGSLIILSEVIYLFYSFIRNDLYKTAGFRFLAVGQIILILGILLDIFPSLMGFRIPSTVGISLVIFNAMFSIAIADKINLLKNQKETAQEKALEFLEEKVAERTKEVMAQKRLIEEKQKEIIDSIHYAKRIQTALITSEKYIDKSLKKLNNNKS